MSNFERYSTDSYFEGYAGYCRAVRLGDRVVVSGTAPTAPEGKELSEIDTYEQTLMSFRAALASAEKLGGTRERTVITRMYLAPDASWEEASKAHSEMFGDHRPANTTLYIHRLIPPGALIEVEIECGLADEKGSQA